MQLEWQDGAASRSGGFMPIQLHEALPPPAQLPQASPPPPQGRGSTHLSMQHLQKQGQGILAGVLGGVPKIGVPLMGSPFGSFHLQ